MFELALPAMMTKRRMVWQLAALACEALDAARDNPGDKAHLWYAMGAVHCLGEVYSYSADWSSLRVMWGLT